MIGTKRILLIGHLQITAVHDAFFLRSKVPSEFTWVIFIDINGVLARAHDGLWVFDSENFHSILVSPFHGTIIQVRTKFFTWQLFDGKSLNESAAPGSRDHHKRILPRNF